MAHTIQIAVFLSATEDEVAVLTSTSTIVAPQGRITTCQDYSQAHHMPHTGKLGLCWPEFIFSGLITESVISSSSGLKMTGTYSIWMKTTFMNQSLKISVSLLSTVSQWSKDTNKWINKMCLLY